MANELKTLKPTKKPGDRKKQCQHYWSYEHAVYSMGDGGDDRGIAVHRQCSTCGVHELLKVHQPKWTRSVKGFSLPDLRAK